MIEKRSILFDSPRSYGWISIAIHWFTAAIVVTMWLIGVNISSQSSADSYESMRNLHLTLGFGAWGVLVGRVVWRIRSKHPHTLGQTTRAHHIARNVHYLILLCLAIMMISGPALAYNIFFGGQSAQNFRIIHAYTAYLLGMLVLMHVLGALKHLMFHDDDTFLGMLRPGHEDAAGPDDTTG